MDITNRTPNRFGNSELQFVEEDVLYTKRKSRVRAYSGLFCSCFRARARETVATCCSRTRRTRFSRWIMKPFSIVRSRSRIYLHCTTSDSENMKRRTNAHDGMRIVYRRRIIRRVIINVHTYLSLITCVAFTNQVTRLLLLGATRNAYNYMLRVLPVNCVQENIFHPPSLTSFSCLYRVYLSKLLFLDFL